ncbi:hypothetical protein [Sphingobacterium deserti]|uniref:Thioredoxin domain-containing protein n=1 Tax=Sphingobacterium deserti TaxID=1229276 RepID=A0A0B8T1D5_9SPHI|nr:hypothetical protein [Sphingobacterium deserti]KGE14687.1 hypothetical protein DI53_1716 [Sphingobacterium deserti]
MKLSLYIIVTVAFFTACKSPFHGLSDQEKRKYQVFKYSDSTKVADDLLAITSEDIPTLTHENNRNLIIFFTSWCPGSKENIPKVITTLRNSDINIVLITPDDYYFKSNYEKYRAELDYSKSVYFLDADVYTSWNPHKKMKAFMKEAFPAIKNVRGFPSGLYTENGQVVASGIINTDFIDSYLRK